jgi:hypothetical protein
VRPVRIGLCAAVAAASVAVAACGTTGISGAPAATSTTASQSASSGTTAPVNAIETAYTSTTSAGTAKIAMTMSVVGQQLKGMSFNVSGNGVMDFAHKTGDLTTNMMGMDVETRYIDGVQYLHLPANLLAMAGGKPWVKVDPSQLPAGGMGSLGGLTSTTTDPSQVLSYLRGMGSNITVDGPATIDGTPTTHYTAQLTVAELAKNENLSADQVAQMQKLLGNGPVPVQLWVDGQNLLRQVSFQQSMDIGAVTGQSSGPGSGSVTMSMTMKLSDFGTPVNVTAPPADQVEDAQNMFGGK